MRDWIKDQYIYEMVSSKPEFYYDEKGNIVFTGYYLRKRGSCCGNGCTNCPYTPKHVKGNKNI